MFVVMFEVQPRLEQWDTYLGLAKFLRPEIEQIDGFIDNERFASRRTSGRLLSLSTWRDEKALIRWRTLAVHHDAQERGRTAIFADYHLRIGEVTADTAAAEGLTLGHDRFDATLTGPTAASIVEARLGEGHPGASVIDYEGAAGLVDVECYDSITTPDKLLVLAAWQNGTAMAAWRAGRPFPSARYRAVRVIRDYGMRDRVEAPQYYPPVDAPIAARRANA